MKVLYKSPMNSGQANAKRKELEHKTGMKLTCYHTGNGWNFRPYLHAGISPDESGVESILKVLPVKSSGKSFTQISKETGFSISRVLGISQYILQKKLATPDVCRDGGRIVGMHIS